jgi:hypothetical protein
VSHGHLTSDVLASGGATRTEGVAAVTRVHASTWCKVSSLGPFACAAVDYLARPEREFMLKPARFSRLRRF